MLIFRNKDVAEAAEKFRQVTAAYEVLGNFRLRKLYDKGILHTAGEQFAGTPMEPVVEDDPTTKFYKSRLKRSETPLEAEKTSTVYDFDEWSKEHYSSKVEQKKKSREKHQLKQNRVRFGLA